MPTLRKLSSPLPLPHTQHTHRPFIFFPHNNEKGVQSSLTVVQHFCIPPQRKTTPFSSHTYMTHVWGPVLWKSLHKITFTYPENPSIAHRKTMHEYMLRFAQVLPCKTCSVHFLQLVNDTIPNYEAHALDGPRELSRWGVDVHNDVNARLGKPIYTYEQACIDEKEQVRLWWNPPISSTCRSTRARARLFIMFLVAVCCIAVVAVFMNTKRPNHNAQAQDQAQFQYRIQRPHQKICTNINRPI